MKTTASGNLEYEQHIPKAMQKYNAASKLRKLNGCASESKPDAVETNAPPACPLPLDSPVPQHPETTLIKSNSKKPKREHSHLHRQHSLLQSITPHTATMR